jgi:peptidoglycan/LPS O-acetylase OafA/YrhL
VALRGAARIDDRLLASGEEAGTAPDDRRFRPDVEGLRAVAIALVVLYHANVPGLTGGYVGVDVFFVISGFVITGLLLRERSATGRTSILSFYARRCRRILPAATLVILATVIATYVAIGVIVGTTTADDGRWAAVFLSNFHFQAVGTNYLTANRPPSPLQNFWSLSVEEQFYFVYPTLFLLIAGIKTVRISVRTRLTVLLGLVILGSYWLSVTQTASHSTTAYFSPFTRAWELALGALVAVSTSWLKQLPARAAAVITWSGLATIVLSAFAFNSQTEYPGSLVAIPVVGAALVIACGAVVPGAGAESLLGLGPFRWLGRHSYSLYLWHWPVLVIAAERAGKTALPLGDNLVLIAIAVLVSMVTYRLVENPIRHWQLPAAKTVALGVSLALGTVLFLSIWMSSEHGSSSIPEVFAAPNSGVVIRQVTSAPRITNVSASIKATHFGGAYIEGSQYEPQPCQADLSQSTEVICPLGDKSSHHLMVVYGDSHALMWIPPLETIAIERHWKLVVLGKYSCPAVPLTVNGFPGLGMTPGADMSCDEWHVWATKWIETHRPGLLIVSQSDSYGPPQASGTRAIPFTGSQWEHGLTKLFTSFRVPNMRMVLLGTTPILARPGPICLESHPHDVQACSTPVSDAESPLNKVDKSTAAAQGLGYVDTLPWFCSTTCTPIIGNYEVYDESGNHVGGAWAQFLQTALAQALGFRVPTR